MTIVILPDGRVLLPRGEPFLADIARALGDERAATFCDQAETQEVIVGKRMCG